MPAPKQPQVTVPAARNPRDRPGRSKPAPVKFPALESVPTQAAEAATSITGSYNKPLLPANFESDSLAAAAAMARQADAILDTPLGEDQSKRAFLLIGAGALAVLLLVVGTVKLFASRHEPVPRPVAVAAHPAPNANEIADLVTRIEGSLTADDFRSAALQVQKLRELSPSHPRLAFFQSLIDNNARSARASLPQQTKANERTSKQARRAQSANSQAASAAVAKAPSAVLAPAGSSGQSLSNAAQAPVEPAHAAALGATTAAQIAPPPAPTPAATDASSDTAGQMPADSAMASQTTAPATAQTIGPATAQTIAPTVAPASSPATPPAASSAAARRPQSSDEPPPVIREAKLIRRVNPDYPSAARRDNIEGFVDLEVTVSASGNVTDVRVAHAEPAAVFDKAALSAVRKWKYDPQYTDGLASQAVVKVHLVFKGGEAE